jgi:hypothetical protein
MCRRDLNYFQKDFFHVHVVSGYVLMVSGHVQKGPQLFLKICLFFFMFMGYQDMFRWAQAMFRNGPQLFPKICLFFHVQRVSRYVQMDSGHVQKGSSTISKNMLVFFMFRGYQAMFRWTQAMFRKGPQLFPKICFKCSEGNRLCSYVLRPCSERVLNYFQKYACFSMFRGYQAMFR